MEGTILSLTNIPVVLVFLVVFLICYVYLGKGVKLPSGPPGLPVLGHILWFSKLQKKGIKRHLALFEASKTYGDIISLWVPGQMFEYLHGYDTIRDGFVKNADTFSDRPSWLKGLKKTTREGKGVLWQSGNEWKVTRKFVLQTLRDFGVGKTSLEEKIMREVDSATEYLNATDEKPTDIRILTSMMISNVIYGIVFAKRFDFNDEQLHTIIENLDALFQRGGVLNAKGIIPNFLLKVISEKGNMFRIIMDLFIAGSETTSNTINWCVLYMQEYPEIQKKCRDEISEKFGNKDVTWADRNSLPYVEATLLEIQRMANIALLSVPHTNEVDTTFGGYYIPRRTVIVANLYSSNMDPRHWNQTDVFNPDRFMEDGKLKKQPALIPFSTCPRICLGESLAKMEMFLIFTNLLQRFTFCREDENVKHSFDSIVEQATTAPIPYKTRAIKRV